ncbi:MAG: peptidoglycan DD-metalloendopeptidase family protein [Candidatus Marinarcus sp.]|uniref:M23 family metallopeptidase n=1 Tax=Candidatus Marinarcus sp. TaxID=3100987 RepID=UPI003AFFE3DD
MKNRLIITVSDINGTKSYNIHQFIKKSVKVIVPLFLVILSGAFWFISALKEDITEIKKEKEYKIRVLEEKESKLKAQNSMYSMQIKDKIKDIDELGSKLDDIEELIGIKGNDTSSLIQRATLARMDTTQKMFMLQIIPSGSPLAEVAVTASFGYRIHPVTHDKKFHRGIDLRAKMRTPVHATADGVVKYILNNDRGGFGRVVMILHNYGFETVYAHLNSIKVKVGDVIRKGQIVGLSGNSGRSTGPHLHYEVKYATKILDPWDFIKWNIKNYEAIFQAQRRVEWESLVAMINSHKNKLAQQ